MERSNITLRARRVLPALAVVAVLGLSVAPASPRAGTNRSGVRVDAVLTDPFVQQGSKLTPSGEIGNGNFGFNVAISADGGTAVITAPHDNDPAGAAWVYTRAGSTWTQQAKLLPSEVSVTNFGLSAALSADGNTALIGSYGQNGQAGGAWVFTRSGSSWTQQGPMLTPSDEVGNGEFGRRVALSADGNTALIGGNQDNGFTGAAWVFPIRLHVVAAGAEADAERWVGPARLRLQCCPLLGWQHRFDRRQQR
jgi:hypothetical protein